MLLRLSSDKGRASAIGSRYFTTDAEWQVVDSSAYAFSVEPEERKNKSGDVIGYVFKSPAIKMTEGARGSLLLSTHPSLGGDIKLITSDVTPSQGYLTVSTKDLSLNLPYHFRVGILPHGHLS